MRPYANQLLRKSSNLGGRKSGKRVLCECGRFFLDSGHELNYRAYQSSLEHDAADLLGGEQPEALFRRLKSAFHGIRPERYDGQHLGGYIGLVTDRNGQRYPPADLHLARPHGVGRPCE